MPTVLSGIQPSGQLHLGNWAGAIRQFVDLQRDHDLFVFVASYHALTTTRGEELRSATRQVVIDYLAFGLDPHRAHIYLQQDVPEVTELAWILSCVCPKHLMDKAVSFKDKVARGLSASVGLYTYPILQAADILIVDADLVPVGKDQVQHIEITRDLAAKFNHHSGQEVFKLPDYRLAEHAQVLPGVDGEKMSKSYGNTIDPFMEEKALRKRIMKIVTDPTPQEEPKNPESCTVFQIFQGVTGAGDPRSQALADRYRAGGMGYGHAKQDLYELLMDTFSEARQRRAQLMAHPAQVDEVLAMGAAAARERAAQVMARVRSAAGL
ncbi:MAG: tryptophan--tRNA ligase [Planctomycetota bacterium]|nr:MAG: tryptophan--tRNA ligase [Planctomycetota bacterium]